MALQINKSFRTPLIQLEAEKGKFLIEGIIMPEDASKFFEPVINYCIDYLTNPLPHSIINLRLEYFNTASSRVLYSFMKKFHESADKTTTKVNWFYEDDDEDLRDACDEYIILLKNITFEKIPYKEEN
jgi:hypothetical protein